MKLDYRVCPHCNNNKDNYLVGYDHCFIDGKDKNIVFDIYQCMGGGGVYKVCLDKNKLCIKGENNIIKIIKLVEEE